ncbi:hypothetical protein [Streptomyces sp. NPDC005336]
MVDVRTIEKPDERRYVPGLGTPHLTGPDFGMAETYERANQAEA